MFLVQYSVSMRVNGDCNWMPEVCTGGGYPGNVHVTLVTVIVTMLPVLSSVRQGDNVGSGFVKMEKEQASSISRIIVGTF